MNILIFNCGSSSLKYKIIRMPDQEEVAGGEAQRIGPKTAEPSRLVYRIAGKQHSVQVDMTDHYEAFQRVIEHLVEHDLTPELVAHRMVHGGTLFNQPLILTDHIIADLETIQDLAPIHNPPALALIKACRQLQPDLPQAVVFDTAYHATIPPYAYTYALPAALREKLGIRKFGFHGTSHWYVAGEAARLLRIPFDELNAVSCHLGSGGASLCAIIRGKSVDNTMGYSPLQGLMMSTRCGDLDPAVVMTLLAEHTGDSDAVQNTLNKKSGVLGMSGMSADIRDILNARSADGDMTSTALITSRVYTWRIRKYLGSYLAVVREPHAIIFTDTIGESVPEVRREVCMNLETFGVRLDPERNLEPAALPRDVAAPDGRVRIFVIATNEELAIAQQAYSLMKSAA